MTHEHADVSVRPGVIDDAAVLGQIHVESWQKAHRTALGAQVVDAFDPIAFGESWRTGMAQHAPGTAGPEIVGFAALTPAQDPDSSAGDSELSALYVRPSHQREGHGSRLLAAAVDTAKAAGLAQIVTWVLDGDDARTEFLTGAGFAADGAWRELQIDETRAVAERRWCAEISA